eukprot:scaffold10917_cov155-Amphora_coffeaeformis.AAC.5
MFDCSRSYAAAGVPEARADHAVAMARFASDCLSSLKSLTRKLEIELGPDTTELGIRIGIHSGPVTAGVLRGERARFQLFGPNSPHSHFRAFDIENNSDTMNTTARIESTGEKNRIHVSSETAELLKEAGKGAWVTAREEKVVAKGKGELETYWLSILSNGRSSLDATEHSSCESTSNTFSIQEEDNDEYGSAMVEDHDKDKLERLVDWNVEILSSFLKDIAKRRQEFGKPAVGIFDDRELIESTRGFKDGVHDMVSEVVEIIHLPDYTTAAALQKEGRKAKKQQTTAPVHGNVTLSGAVSEQLRAYIRAIASMYRENPFHNFEHASHVTLSVTKLLSRIVAPAIDLNDTKTLHDHTYGITSDPLTQFAVVLSAIFHDVDHAGVPNTQLVAEGHTLAIHYNGKSVAEQNSIDLSWELLMDDSFQDLRRAIYTNADEFKRFRQLVVNAVLATDIMDKEFKTLRNARWAKAFKEQGPGGLPESEKDSTDRKATIVIEHLIQASDVAHTMQHWHVYCKWNQRLFFEMYKAYKEGRATKNPADFWVEGEKGFLDFYIIPLAKKLKDCGIFGVSSDEYLQYAEKNRREWEQRGKHIVSEMIEEAMAKYGA